MLIPYCAPPQPPEPEKPTGVWAMDPFMECDFMLEHYSSSSSPEVFGRSISDEMDEPPSGPVVEPDPVIMGLPPSSASASDDVGGEDRSVTMWMRIEEEKRRRAQDPAASD